MGKGWAKGLTAATDPRVARSAEGHRGQTYVRRTPVDQCRWQIRSRTTLEIGWSQAMAYVVGLTATDGCLVTGRRVINFKSVDRALVALYLQLLGRTNHIGWETTRSGGVAYKTQFGDARLYEWFRSIGLGPQKSLTLGELAVPDEFLLALARGLLDGDGTILNKTYRADTKDRADYRWEYLQTRFVSASRPHLEWLRTALRRVALVDGYLYQCGVTSAGNPMFQLRYGKTASLVLLPQLYPDIFAPCLERKRAIWLAYVERGRMR